MTIRDEMILRMNVKMVRVISEWIKNHESHKVYHLLSDLRGLEDLDEDTLFELYYEETDGFACKYCDTTSRYVCSCK